MKNILKSSSKLGLIAAVLLLASACGEESTRGDAPVSAGSPLVEIQAIEPGDVCEFGGSLVLNGVDKDKNGELEESEIVSQKEICKSAPTNGGGGGGTNQDPASPLIKTESLAFGDSDCPNGGQRITAGVDLDEDDELTGDEIKSSTLLCTEVGACEGVAPLEIIDAEFEQDYFGQYEIGLEYEIRVELNQSIDKNIVKIQDATGSLGDGSLPYEIDADNDHIAILKWAPSEVGNMPILAMIDDGCSLVASDSQLPYAQKPGVRVRVTAEVKGLLNEGDKTEICWTSRHADSCEFQEFGATVGPVDTEGCMDIELTAAHIAYPAVLMDYKISCTGIDAQNGTGIRSHAAPLYKQPIMSYFFGDQPHNFAAAGEETNLYWETFGMESCSLSDGVAPIAVDHESLNDSDTPYTVTVEETTDFTLSCEDALNNTYEQKVRYLVGPGLMQVSGGLYAPNNAISIVWSSIDVDGTCDVKYTNNGHTLEYNDVVQNQAQIQDGFETRSTNLYKANLDISMFDFSKEELHEVTCYNADKSKSYSLSFIKP